MDTVVNVAAEVVTLPRLTNAQVRFSDLLRLVSDHLRAHEWSCTCAETVSAQEPHKHLRVSGSIVVHNVTATDSVALGRLVSAAFEVNTTKWSKSFNTGTIGAVYLNADFVTDGRRTTVHQRVYVGIPLRPKGGH